MPRNPMCASTGLVRRCSQLERSRNRSFGLVSKVFLDAVCGITEMSLRACAVTVHSSSWTRLGPTPVITFTVVLPSVSCLSFGSGSDSTLSSSSFYFSSSAPFVVDSCSAVS